MHAHDIPLFPEQASTMAAQVDYFYFFLIAVSLFFGAIIAVMLVGFSIRFRRRHPDQVGHHIHGSTLLEIAWSVIPFGITMVIFAWGVWLFFGFSRPPDNAHEVFVVGKQWMWKLQHPQGKREINELHVPVGQTVKLVMTSEDVIHSFYIPAFRVKNDVVPGKYTTVWFEATKVGQYHLFCAEYCGTEHSKMGGTVHVVTAAEYEQWLRGAGGPTESPAAAGAKLYAKLGCATCHNGMPGALGPDLTGIYGHKVELTDGTSVVVDDAYLRESILNSQAKIVKGFQPVMPIFKGMVTEEQLLQIMAYIKSLAKTDTTGSGG